MRSGHVIAVLCLLGSSATAQADVRSRLRDAELQGLFGVRIRSTNSGLGSGDPASTSLANSVTLGARLILELGEWTRIEAELPVSITSTRDDRARAFVAVPRAQLLLELLPDSDLQPFSVVGGGAPMVLSFDSEVVGSGALPELYVGAGLRFERATGVSLRLDARWSILPAREESRLASEFEVLATLYRARRPAPAGLGVGGAVAALADSDADGVPDDRDACPGRPEDRDDFEDGDGCPDIDNDLDGVLDIADECPDEKESYNGFRDDDGCIDFVPAEVSAAIGVLRDLEFDARGKITRPGRRALRQVAAVMDKFPSIRIEVVAHTYARGDEAAEQSETQQRADSVAEYLNRQGAPASRVRARGRGSEEPIADSGTRRGRRRNQRIEIRLLVSEAH